jgi:oligopeptidase A
MSTTPGTNPLLQDEPLPIPFHRIRAEHVAPGIRAALARAEAELAELVAAPGERTYTNTVGPAGGDHGTAFARHPPRFGAGEPDEHARDPGGVRHRRPGVFRLFRPHRAQWRALGRGKGAAESPEAATLDRVRRRHLEKTVRAFVRAGADLGPAEKERVEALRVELSRLQTEFSNHVLDSTNAWEMVLADEAELAGLPESARTQARAAAEARGVEGWRFTLHQPSVQPFLQYAERRDLRQRIHLAYANRAAEAPHDNRPLVGRILALRRELAQLLGFRDWADYELEEAMARSGERAMAFEEDLTARTRPFWEARDRGAGGVRPRRAGAGPAAALGRRLRHRAHAPRALRPGCGGGCARTSIEPGWVPGPLGRGGSSYNVRLARTAYSAF